MDLRTNTPPAVLPAGLTTLTWAVIDFEGLTPAGRPPEPIEVAAVSGRLTDAGTWVEAGRFTSLMRPPPEVSVTDRGVAMTGITREMLSQAPTAAEVMADLDGLFGDPPYRLVAHHAATEATLIGGQRRHCPTLAAIPLICTVKLARLLLPELSSHKLDLVARRLGLQIPADRHRALPDVELTLQVFIRLMVQGAQAGRWRNLLDLQAVGGVYVKSEARPAAGVRQSELF
ncbi:PolC-type DNA polymerase III [Nonomuraea sp. NPDC059023]|uniref:3'-5' exonuclease n=1 Tax=unclassified Nonomuraea TaxID=2593643 RepID=UPI0036CC83F2